MTRMKLRFAALILPLAAMGLAACADDYYGAGYAGGGYHHPRGGVYYDGYYDDFYGPIYGGYWAGDVYWYQTRRGGPYRVDHDRHFRHEQFDRSHNFHYRDWGHHPRH
jgi:hypothetical protein